MIVATTPRLAALGPRLRGLVLVLVALYVSHDAVYLAEFGPGGYRGAMSGLGHDAYWLPASLVVTVLAAVAFLTVLRRIARLDHPAAPVAAVPGPGPSYWHECLSTWIRLWPAVAAGFLLQENAEWLASHGSLAGLDPLFGSRASLVPWVLGIVTFLLAAVGAVLRWRVRVLEARLAAARAHPVRPGAGSDAPARWRVLAAFLAHRSILLRRDAGRAPPRSLSTSADAA